MVTLADIKPSIVSGFTLILMWLVFMALLKLGLHYVPVPGLTQIVQYTTGGSV